MSDDRRDDLGGWGPKAWDLLHDRVNALRADVNVLMGRPSDAGHDDESRTRDPRPGGVGLATWVSIVALVVVPIVLAILLGDSPK